MRIGRLRFSQRAAEDWIATQAVSLEAVQGEDFPQSGCHLAATRLEEWRSPLKQVLGQRVDARPPNL